MTTIYQSSLFGCCLAFLFLVATAANGADDYRFRSWDLPSGETIEAQFQRIKGNNVVLLNRGGEEKTISLLDLSADDKAYVRLTNRGPKPDENLVESAKAIPFVIDFSKGEKFRHAFTYPGKVDIKNAVVEFTISGNGNREFPSSTRQNQPVDLGQHFKCVVRLAPIPAKKTDFDLAVDVEAWMSYDLRNAEFTVFVKPSVNVIRGRGGAESIPLSDAQFNERIAVMKNTIMQSKRAVERFLPEQIRDLERNDGVSLQGEVSWIGLIRQRLTRKHQIPAMQNKYEYLVKLAYALGDMESITVQYRIFLKVGGNLKLIVDGNSKH